MIIVVGRSVPKLPSVGIIPGLPAMPPPYLKPALGGNNGINPVGPHAGLGKGPYPGGLPYPYGMMPAYVPPIRPMVRQVPLPPVPVYQPPPSPKTREEGYPVAKASPEKKEIRIVPPPSPEAANRMRYHVLSVVGVRNTNDRDRLEFSVGKLKEVRGVTVRRRDDGDATMKVWFSEREPIETDDIIEASAKLGFQAAITETN